jgi:hypothetical protein
VNDFRYLSQEETLRLDWSDPWYSTFERKTLKRRYSAPAAAFLYIENFEVRKEIVFRPKDLQQWIDLGIEDQLTIASGDRDSIRAKAAEFLAEHTPVKIDGESASGTLDRVHFIERTLRSSGVVEPGMDIDVNTALIGAIYIYPIESLPDHVTMGWDLFSDRISRIPTVASDEAGGLPSFIEQDDPRLAWQNYLTNPTAPAFMAVPPLPQPKRVEVPIASLVLALLVGAVWVRRFRRERASRPPLLRPMMLSAVLVAVAVMVTPWTTLDVVVPGTAKLSIADKDAEDVARSLLHNVYRAFDYRDEGAIYDVLDHSVFGDLLTTIYLETRQSLTLAKQGGARVKVTEVELTECQSEPMENDVGFIATCEWNVTGSVGHWGHLHQRRNQYRAEFELRPSEGQWKIHDMQLLDEERIF